MALLAARTNDLHVCPTHGPGELTDGVLDVRINGKPTPRVGDVISCRGCAKVDANRLKTGASTVTIRGEMATRLTDTSDHGGIVVVGSANVVIGGPSGMGCIGAGKGNCQAMAAGRKSGETHQSYGNCMVESVRQMLRRAKGEEITEDQLMSYVMFQEPPMAYWNPGQSNHGAMSAYQATQVLGDFGVGADVVPRDGKPTLDDIKTGIAGRKGVIAIVQTSPYWPGGQSAVHAVMVTGVELDRDGHVTAVFLNDTGLGICGMKVPADKFSAALQLLNAPKLVVTKEPIW